MNTARGLVKKLRAAAARVQCAQYESEGSDGAEPGTTNGTGAVAGEFESLIERIREYMERIEKLAQEQVALLQQVKGVGALVALISY